MMQESIEKASHLIEALPYIRRFYGKTFVIKCGGAAMTDEQHMRNIMQDIALLHFCGIRVVVVHGGGKDISTLCEQLHIPTQFSNGLRVTDAATMEVVQMVLIGKTNMALVTALNQFGVKAVGIAGQDAACLKTKKIHQDQGMDLGFVGDYPTLDTTLINTLLGASFLPVIAPVGVDNEGRAYNVNADLAASAVAAALKAEKLIVLSDVNGVYANLQDPGTQIQTITVSTIKTWLKENRISGGMIPKLQACLQALEHGVINAHILDGNMTHSMLLEIFTDQGVGTQITH